MIAPSLLLLLIGMAIVSAKTPPEPYSARCLVGEASVYDPNEANQVPWYNVNLDAPAKDRFREIAGSHARNIKEVIDVVKTMGAAVQEWLIPFIEYLMTDVHQRLPEPFKTELEGMAEASGISIEDLTMMNLFYELSRFCTSIVAYNTKGEMYHGRNLDFGQLFIWDTALRSWGMTEKLKAVTINVNFIKNGQLAFKATTFAGHAGVITAMKPNAFTLSMNAKVKPDLPRLMMWLTGMLSDIHFAVYVEREVMERADTFQEAVAYVQDVQQIAGCYYIIGGTKPGEGVVITRNETQVIAERWMDVNDPEKWFVLQTNYDEDQTPLYIDDRRTPGYSCMRQLSSAGLNASGLYQVLSSKTTLNKTTAHTVIMSLTTGLYQAFKRICPDPCWFL